MEIQGGYNYVDLSGTGIEWKNSIKNCTFINIMSPIGSSIYLSFPGNIEVSNCSFNNNYAQYGSAIYFIQESNA